MGADLAVADVEGLVVNEKADHLGVGDVDHRLTGFGVAVTRLGEGQRAGLVDAAQVRAWQAVRFAFVQVASQADVAVGESEDGLALCEDVEVERRLPHAPRLDGVGGMGDHDGPISSARSATTTSAPWEYSASAWPTRSTPTTRPNPPALPASTPDSASSKTAASPGSTPSAAGCSQVGVRCGLALEVALLDAHPVDASLEQPGDASGDEHVGAVRAGGHDGPVQSGGAHGLHVADRAHIGLDTVVFDLGQDELVLGVAEP